MKFTQLLTKYFKVIICLSNIAGQGEEWRHCECIRFFYFIAGNHQVLHEINEIQMA